MELINSTINDTWKLCTFGSLLACLIILLFLNQNDQQNLSFSTIITPNITRNTIATLANTLIPSNYTINIVENTNNTTLEYVKKPSLSNPSHVTRSINTTEKKCNVFDGRWVYKANEVRRYDTSTCPFLEEKMSCQNNGRPDFEYEKWRWEATNCDIPLFNGTDMLEKLRNKRVIIVGDSLNRNMWESLACLLYTSIPSSRAYVQAKGDTYKIFKAMDYNCVIEFYWSPFLIELDEKHYNGKKVLVLDKLSESAKQWKGADVMVFNSGHWWTHLGKLKSWDFIQYKGNLTEEMPIDLAYKRAMKTWAKWIKKSINPEKTSVFFRSISPEHKGEQWCYNATQPIMDESYTSLFPKTLIDVIETRIEEMNNNLKVKYLNITKLSSYRRDAHPSIYRSNRKENQVESFADCSHWCLPGLPDTWNRLFYVSLFYTSKNTLGNMSSL